jgi:putative peptide zinc metalloprotease protein
MGQLLIDNMDPELDAAIDVDQARVDAASARFTSEQFNDRVQAGLTLRELELHRFALADARGRATDLSARARMAGRFVISQPDDLPGRYFKRGEVLGYVLPEDRRRRRPQPIAGDVDLRGHAEHDDHAGRQP